MTREHPIQKAILDYCQRPHIQLWRNNTGARVVEGRYLQWGLAPGSSDIIGIRRETIGGRRVGRFVALECKRAREKPTLQQASFLRYVEGMGGIAGVVHSLEEAMSILGIGGGSR